MVLPATCSDVGEMLSREHAQEKSENRQCLLRILSNIHFLSRQGLALRGDGDVTFYLVYIIVLYMCMAHLCSTLLTCSPAFSTHESGVVNVGVMKKICERSEPIKLMA